jgi:hypothetical protein
MSHYDKPIRDQVVRKKGKYIFRDQDGTARDMNRDEKAIWHDGIRFGFAIGVIFIGASLVLVGVIL